MRTPLEPSQGPALAPSRAAVLLRHGAWIVPSLSCLLLGYLAIWQRGYYWDDYIWAVNGLQWRSEFPRRLLSLGSIMLLGVLLTKAELLARAITTALVGINALLLGWLVRRVPAALLPAVIAGWLLLMPAFAWEAVVWNSAAGYLIAASCSLLFLHCGWSVLTRPVLAPGWLLGMLAALAGMLLAMEPALSLVALLPVFGLIVDLSQPARSRRGAALRRSLGLLAAVIGLMVVAIWLLYFGTSSMLASRGGLETRPGAAVQRGVELVGSLYLDTLAPGWGGAVAFEMASVGLREVSRSWAALALACLAVLGVTLTAASWRGSGAARQSSTLALVLVAAGLGWFAATLLFPASLLRAQGFAPRLLYLPSAGAALAVGAGCWALVLRLRHPALERLLVAGFGLVLLGSTVMMVGYCRLMAARSELDRRQMASITQIVPPEVCSMDAAYLYVAADERLFGSQDAVADQFILGVFEQGLYGDKHTCPGVEFVPTDRWTPIEIDGERSMVRVGDRVLPVAHVVPFTFRRGDAVLVPRVRVRRADDSEATYLFPRAQALSARGLPSIESVVLDG
jgi:hypothetical protein